MSQEHAETRRQHEQTARRERILRQWFKDTLVSIGVTPGHLGQDGMTFYHRLNNDAWFRLARAIEARTIPFRFRDERYAKSVHPKMEGTTQEGRCRRYPLRPRCHPPTKTFYEPSKKNSRNPHNGKIMVNKVILVGNLGADPELRSTQSGQSVCSLRLATSERYKDKEGNLQEKTEWHKVVVWGAQADNVNRFCKKGKQVYLEGKIQTRKWQDKEGKDQYTTEIVADTVKFLGSKGGTDDGGQNAPGDDSNASGSSGGYGGGSGRSGASGGTTGGSYGRQNAPARPPSVDNAGFGSNDDIPF